MVRYLEMMPVWGDLSCSFEGMGIVVSMAVEEAV
jgi:hypothetical protein